jgi:fatty acid desaturase
MSEQQRVRVTGPPRRRRIPRSQTPGESDRLGEIYLGSLMRDQLVSAAITLVLLTLGIGSLPLVFWLFPGLASIAPLGVPLPWILLGVLVYPFLVLLGWLYVRRAERSEAAFAELNHKHDQAYPEDDE